MAVNVVLNTQEMKHRLQ